MKEVKQTQHKIHKVTLDIMSGFRLFWGLMLGIVSLFIALGFASIMLYAILFMMGTVSR